MPKTALIINFDILMNTSPDDEGDFKRWLKSQTEFKQKTAALEHPRLYELVASKSPEMEEWVNKQIKSAKKFDSKVNQESYQKEKRKEWLQELGINFSEESRATLVTNTLSALTRIDGEIKQKLQQLLDDGEDQIIVILVSESEPSQLLKLRFEGTETELIESQLTPTQPQNIHYWGMSELNRNGFQSLEGLEDLQPHHDLLGGLGIEKIEFLLEKNPIENTLCDKVKSVFQCISAVTAPVTTSVSTTNICALAGAKTLFFSTLVISTVPVVQYIAVIAIALLALYGLYQLGKYATKKIHNWKPSITQSISNYRDSINNMKSHEELSTKTCWPLSSY